MKELYNQVQREYEFASKMAEKYRKIDAELGASYRGSAMSLEWVLKLIKGQISQ